MRAAQRRESERDDRHDARERDQGPPGSERAPDVQDGVRQEQRADRGAHGGMRERDELLRRSVA
jgi:hypothetical protein